MTVESLDELLALQRAIHEAKFSASPRDRSVSVSPFVAAVYERLLDAIVAAYAQEGNAYKVNSFQQWRRIDAHDCEKDLVVERLTEMLETREAEPSSLPQLAAVMLRPFVFSDADLDAIVSRVRVARA